MVIVLLLAKLCYTNPYPSNSEVDGYQGLSFSLDSDAVTG